MARMNFIINFCQESPIGVHGKQHTIENVMSCLALVVVVLITQPNEVMRPTPGRRRQAKINTAANYFLFIQLIMAH